MVKTDRIYTSDFSEVYEEGIPVLVTGHDFWDKAFAKKGIGVTAPAPAHWHITARRQDTRDPENTDKDANRHPAKTQDSKGESQNVNDDEERPLQTGETGRARNKANEGMRQGRNKS